MNTPKYWDDRYKTGLGAGNGSRGRLYEFKLRTVQGIVDDYGIKSVVDLGCGDGTQMMSLKVDKYIGLDVSEVAIDAASALTSDKRAYMFINEDTTAKGQIVDMAMSLDVIFHLPDDQYKGHMDTLFRLAKKYVLIYAPDSDGKGIRLASHMQFHKFSEDVPKGWKQVLHVPSEFPIVNGAATSDTSYCEFYLYEKKQSAKREVTR